MSAPGVYLTFDDGPHTTATEEVLSALNEHKAAATFFLLGENVEGRESLVREIAAEGHTIGIHGYHHSRFPALSKHRTRDEILRAEKVVSSATTSLKRIYRPPYGFFSWASLRAAKELGYRVVLWTVLTGDFRDWKNSKVVSTALKGLRDGNVLVFHDNGHTTGRIGSLVSECVGKIKEAGFQLNTV